MQVKTRGNPADMAPLLEQAIHEVDGRLPVFDVRTMRETTQMSSMFAVMQSTFAGMFAIIASDLGGDRDLRRGGVSHATAHA